MSVVTGNDIMKLIRAIKTDSKRGFYITQPVRNKRGKMTYKRKYLNKQEIAKIRNQMVAKVDRSKFRDINQVFIYGQTKKRTYKRKKKEEPEQIQQTDKSTGYRLPSLASQFYSQGNRAYVGRNIETSALQGIKDLEQLKSKDKEIERLRGIVNTRSLKEYDDRALKQQADKLIQKERELTFLKNQLVEFEDKMNKLIAQRIDPKVIEDMKNVRDKMLKEINDMRTQMVKDEKDFMGKVKDYLIDGKVDQARDLCVQTNNPAARMVEKGISRIGKPMRDIVSSIENVGKLEIYQLERRLSFLATAAGVAPMIGFLGTTLGMVKTFFALKSETNIEIASISGGIMEAMVTTVAGLVVGIIAYSAYNYLVAKVDKVIHTMEGASIEFLDLLNEPGK
jgi:biopolymer transport protein ExbB